MLGIDRKAVRITWSAAFTLLALAAIYAIRGTLIVFAVALLFAYLLYPVVDFISQRLPPKNRIPALAITYLLVLGILTAGGIWIGSQVLSEFRELIAHPPDLQGFFQKLQAAHPSASPMIGAAETRIRQQFSDMISSAPRVSFHVLAASTNLIDLVIIPILSFFILKDGRVIRDGFLGMFRLNSHRAEAERTIAEIHDLLLQYMRALLILCCNALVVFSIVLSAMSVPYALLLAAFAFFCEFVPLMGPAVAAATIIVVSALSGYGHVLWVVIFLGIFRILQDYVISPKIMGRGVELHPMLILFGVFAGAELGGVAGVFLSVPLLALGRLILRRIVANSK